MIQVSNRTKPLHQQFSELDNKVFSAFCDTFKSVKWIADYKDSSDKYCGIDLQLSAMTKSKLTTYDCELKSIHLNKFLSYCFFQTEKWYSLLEWDNENKLYIAIYPNHNKIVIWNVNRELLRKSEKEYQAMKKNTCIGSEDVTKQVYKLKISDGKVFNFDLSKYREKYNALYKQISNKKA